MPSWGIHLAIAKNLSSKLQVEKDGFLFGNLMPDINTGYVIHDVSKVIPHQKTHYKIIKQFGDNIQSIPNCDQFYQQYKNELDNPVVLGYLTHLLADYYFNDQVYTQKGIYNQGDNTMEIKLNNGEILKGTRKEIRDVKEKDFKIFSKFLFENHLSETPKYHKFFALGNEVIKEVNVTDEDVKKVLGYVNQYFDTTNYQSKENNNQNYAIFSQQEMTEKVNECTEFIVDYLNKNQTKSNSIYKTFRIE